MANEKRLIDAGELLSVIHQYDEKQKSDVWLTEEIEYLLAEQPTVDAVEVVHGRWRMETDEEEPNPLCKVLVCSVCGKMGGRNFYYCPNCGAKMDGGNEDA